MDNAIVSDDIIRVRVNDEIIRHWILNFLQSSLAKDQLDRNEYGTVQQHIEPHHVSGLLVPIPEDWASVRAIINKSMQASELRQRLAEMNDELVAAFKVTLDAAIKEGEEAIEIGDAVEVA
jgi:type I restriction enzyme M protein